MEVRGRTRIVGIFGVGRDGGGMSSPVDVWGGSLEVWLAATDGGGCDGVEGLRGRRVELYGDVRDGGGMSALADA